MQKGTQVRLKSFSGKLVAPKNKEPWNNYWKLIGQKGIVIDDVIYNDRVLVLFETSLDTFKVANHNPIPNSLWIKPTDLELDNEIV
jgi:hypothetical protein